MGVNAGAAYQLCVNAYGNNPQSIRNAIEKQQPGTAPTSCHANMVVLATTAFQGFPPVPANAPDPHAALQSLSALLSQDVVIVVDISPDHHFVLFPLEAANTMALLQGFQGEEGDGYTVYEWIQSGKAEMPIDAFLQNFRLLISASKSMRQAAAASLFSIAGNVEYVKEWYNNQVSVPSMSYCGLGG